MADRLNTAFVLGYHGCDERVAEKLLAGEPFEQSENKYDWLGSGIYFWEKNPERGLDFAKELAASNRSSIKKPAVVGAIIDLGLCLDLSTKGSIDQVRQAHEELVRLFDTAEADMPDNDEDGLRRNLDCAVINLLHKIREDDGEPPIQSVRGVFFEGDRVYETAGFYEKTHTQICIRDPKCVKGVFRV
jgi:hypothetical protein